MNANLGDVIKWSYEDNDYYARVDAILDGGYGVNVVYEDLGTMRIIITEDRVLAVYKLDLELIIDNIKEF